MWCNGGCSVGDVAGMWCNGGCSVDVAGLVEVTYLMSCACIFAWINYNICFHSTNYEDMLCCQCCLM